MNANNNEHVMGLLIYELQVSCVIVNCFPRCSKSVVVIEYDVCSVVSQGGM